jgi:hypothetical protein
MRTAPTAPESGTVSQQTGAVHAENWHPILLHVAHKIATIRANICSPGGRLVDQMLAHVRVLCSKKEESAGLACQAIRALIAASRGTLQRL